MQRIDVFLSDTDNARVGVLRSTCFLFPVHTLGGTAWRSASCTACAYCVWDLLISGRTGMARDLYQGSCHECLMASLAYGSCCLCTPRTGNVIPMKRPWDCFDFIRPTGLPYWNARSPFGFRIKNANFLNITLHSISSNTNVHGFEDHCSSMIY